MKLPIDFQITGLRAGLYKNPKKLDLALFYSKKPCNAAGVFTTNQVKAAPILISQKHIQNKIHAIIANSGCANACTGKQGLQDAEQICEWTAESLQIQKQQILIASTGVIGKFLPLQKIKIGIQKIARSIQNSQSTLSPLTAVEAIMTTDTVPKWTSTEIIIKNKKITLWGCAKGSGMIHPNMATLFSFILTDAEIAATKLRALLKETVDQTFNRLSVDGDTSTNDCTFILANGASSSITTTPELQLFKTALKKICGDLAQKIAADGEGATKQITIDIQNSRTEKEAKKIAETIATSPLVKTAFFGEDANWGRILAAMGRSGVSIDPNKISILFDHLYVFKNGTPINFSEKTAKKILQKKSITLTINLNQGKTHIQYFTCDFSIDYVKINADYRS